MGGEKLYSDEKLTDPWGSPPRGRGKVFSMMHTSTSTRITPAWAGKSFRTDSPAGPAEDHPRVGGEKPALRRLSCTVSGSPPRGRGKDLGYAYKGLRIGITPAWAGKSRRGSTESERAEDHPRVGGEKRRCVRRDVFDKGSPPRGRGKEGEKPMYAAALRITPAWAGKRKRFR